MASGPFADAGLLSALQDELNWVPVEADWSFRADQPEGGFNRYAWGPADQVRFDECWDNDVAELVCSLISTYGAMWPWAVERVVVAHYPCFAACVRGLAERKEVGRGNTYRDSADAAFSHAMMYGAFDHVRSARGPTAWPPAPSLLCPLCGIRFSAAILSPWMIRQYGPPRFCNRCCVRARCGRPRCGRDAALAGVQRLAAAIEGIPGQQFAQSVSLAGMADERRDSVMVGLIGAPAPDNAKALFGATWLRVLQSAGLVGDAWRPARGTYCVAADGHDCRSLAERTIDDFLTAHGIAHEPEPRYPGSTRRADWRLEDGTFVEYAGLMADAAYAAKMAEKRATAERAGVRLLILVPEDLPDLRRAMASWMPRL